MEPIWIDKIEVAERQIAEAVKLFFEKRDLVVIHTVIASAHQVLIDVGKEQKINSAIKNPKGLTRQQYRQHIKSINVPYNFFKHADNDPNGKLNIAPIERFTSDFILDAILMLQRISGNIPLEAKVFWGWFVATYPDEFDDCPNNGAIKNMMEMGLADWDFPTIHQFLIFGEILYEKS
ncbi:hypothetical protein [Ghiorsea bivora]|uniref:hypothetical protein n=1 Tax=Ghiorsea bivora TaxID=1485545 RepID=UPI0005710EB3|nr:hypothetical protein [Ghiorsea bivora]